jgi:hypothetical protein
MIDFVKIDFLKDDKRGVFPQLSFKISENLSENQKNTPLSIFASKVFQSICNFMILSTTYFFQTNKTF